MYILNIGPNVSTQDPTDFKRCTPAKVKAWWEAVKQNVPNYNSYNWHIVGGMANGSQDSLDADIVLTPLSGEVYDSSELPLLQSILVSAQQLALDNKFFVDIKAVPYHWSSPLGFTRSFFKIGCWDKITVTIDEETTVKSNVYRRRNATSIEKLGELDLWKVSWNRTGYEGELFFPFGSTEKAENYTAGYVPVEDWCNVQ
jgi:hypothetical protein|tara:strand:- start:4617 stop:5216 length:600 start_codon:yes stop_codon:yes gene_type:complete